jgi:two-component system, LytTR family, response regulator
MPLLRTLIIEDDPSCREVLIELLTKYIPDAVVIGEAGTQTQALSMLKTEKPQLVILNTAIENKSGFQLLDEIGKFNFELIFTTSNEAHALEAYNYPAADMLLKPITPDLIKRGFSRAMDRYYSMKTYDENRMILDFKLRIPEGKKEKTFVLEQISRVEANRNYSWIITRNESPYLTSKSLAELGKILLQLKFIRVHISHMVNTLDIKKFHPSLNQIEMNDGSMIPVSRARRKTLNSILFQYISGQV